MHTEPNTKATLTEKTRSYVLIVVSLCCLVNGLLFLLIGLREPEYLQDYRKNDNPDARHYVKLGESFWLHGKYSREETPPYRPDILRTPVYPLLAGGVAVLAGAIWPLYVLQVMFAMATSALVCLIASQHFSQRVGIVAGVLLAADLMLAVLNFQAMSESLFVFLSTLSIFLWLRMVWNRRKQTLYSWLEPVVLGLVLGLAILTRPTGLYLPLVLLFVAVLVWRLKNEPIAWRSLVVFVVTSFAVVAPWVIRNQILYGVPRLTTADTINLVYFAGAGVYQLKYGIEREEAQRRIALDYGLTPLEKSNNFWFADEDVATMDSKQRRAARDIISKHPLLFFRSTLVGIAMAGLAHNTDDLAHAIGVKWSAPGLGNLLRGNLRGFMQGLQENDGVLILVFVWQVLLTLGGLVLGVIGCAAALWERPHRLLALSLLAIIGYYMVTVCVVGMDAYSRHRSMIVPLLVIFSAIGLGKIRCLFKDRQPLELGT